MVSKLGSAFRTNMSESSILINLFFKLFFIFNRKFIFEGFLPKKNIDREKILFEISKNEKTTIVYESPHRLKKLLEELDLKDNYFSVRGELVFVNTQKKEIVIKICPATNSKNLKNKNFKLVIKGELSLELLHSFVSLDINRDGNSLKLIKYEVIEKNLSKKLE